MVKRKVQSPTTDFKCSKSLWKDTHAEQEIKSKCLGNLKLRPIKELEKSNLPSNRKVLEFFFSLQNDHKSNIQKKIAEKLLIERNGQNIEIPCLTKTKTKCINNILKLHEEWRNLQKIFCIMIKAICLKLLWN